MNLRLLTSLAALVLAACATESKFAARIDEFVGKPESAIVTKLGPPDRAYPLADGSRVLQWRMSKTVNMVLPGGTTPVQSHTYGQVGTGVGGSFTSTTTTNVPNAPLIVPIDQSCSLNVTVNAASVVTGWSAAGNHCKSK